MTRLLRTALAIAIVATPAAAEGFEPIRDRETFVELVQGRELSLPLFRIRLEVLPDGRIEGEALGWGVKGRWSWDQGYFCRDMDWSGMPIEYNCQLVEAKGSDQVRFTVDKGDGRSASFSLR
jgi:hypothetical protein